jgi:predicted CxxxxCH...CXXCH cytochrome family protein
MALGLALFSGQTVQAAPQYSYNCDFCHHMPPLDSASGKREAATGATKGNHQSHAGTTAATCVKCHGPALTATGHRDKQIQVQGNINNSPKVARYSRAFLNQTSVPPVPLGTCSNVNCHFEQTTPAWGSAAYSAPAACANCHGAPPAGGVTGSAGSHARHDSYFSGTAQCVKCHPNRLLDASPFAHATSAVRAKIKVTLSDPAGAASGSYSGTGANFLPSQSAAQVFGACSNNYCHSTGNPNVAAASLPAAYAGSNFATVTWGSGAQACNSCHGRSTTNGMPDYANAGTPGSATANSHLKHVTGSSISCNECHERTTKNNSSIRPGSLSIHLDKTAEVFFNLSGNNKAASYASAVGVKSCSSTYCHGGAGSTVVWGGAALNCQDCHGGGATASLADFGATFWNNGTISKFQMTGTGSWADTGHGRPTASGAYPGSGNPAANFAGVTNFCEWCHDSTVGHNVSGNPFRLRNVTDATWGKNGVCMLCHATASAGVTVGGQLRNSANHKVGAYHYGAKHSTALSGGQYCWDCHDPHGAGLNSAGSANQYMVRTRVALASDATTGAPTAQSATSVVFTLSATPTGTDYAKSAAPFNGICNVCHATTGHFTSSAGDAHNAGTRCTSCHSHSGDGSTTTSGFTPAGGGVSTGGSACFGCHSNFQAAMSINGSARTSSYHHVLGTSATDAGDLAPNAGSYSTSTSNLYCTSCHADHNYFNNGGTVVTKAANLRSDIAVASGAVPVNTDFLASGSYGICVSCHAASLTRDVTNQKAGGVATTPVIVGADFAASMHNYTTMSSFGTQKFAANCVKCHTDEQAKDKQTSTNMFGPHFSASVSLLDDLGTGTLAQYREQTMCFRCHSQTSDTALGGTRKAVNGKDWFGSNTMRSFAEDTFKSFTGAGRSPRHRISAYTGMHKANETLADLATSKHVECADCHSPHAATFGNHSSSAPGTARGTRGLTIAKVLSGATGVTVTTWGARTATTVWGTNPNTYGQSGTQALPVATVEYQVCFKCHAGTGFVTGGTGAASMTDLGYEFDPNNAARHPVGSALAAASQLTAARLTGGWKPGDVMTCSDCHSTDSTASKGPHGSAVKWMLAGTNKAWPYTTAAGNGGSTGTLYRIATYNTGAGTRDGLFCLNCHTVRPATGVNNWHSNSNVTGGQHGSNAIMACTSCHIRVPHGGKISRLLQTTKAPARYKSNGNGATSSFDFWGTSTVNIKGSAFSSANFNSSCGQHNSGGAGGEAW